MSFILFDLWKVLSFFQFINFYAPQASATWTPLHADGVSAKVVLA